ncbi:MAG: hypothetical protein K0S12_18 [Bacteroidetes bacterium]|nr:hypothetical protein [Bacteroidota bacterium]
MRFSRVTAIILVVIAPVFLFSQRDICILDLTAKNAETTAGNLYSAEHLLKSAGFSYTINISVNQAVKSKILILSSNIETSTFSQQERDSVTSFIGRGGIVIGVNVKDPLLFNVFGISSTLFATNRYGVRFKTTYNDTLFGLFDDVNEKTISLGTQADFSSTVGTRAFTLTGGDTLATYETNEIAAFHTRFQEGHMYVLGTQWKDVILRPQVKEDYNANRSYSNSFEPAQDVYCFLVAGIVRRHLPVPIWKHTAPCNFKSSLVITHDVDATTAIDMWDDYANYERINEISSTYLVTTHYVHDKLAKNFFDGYEDDILKVKNMSHDIQSHSVSHVPDFDVESTVPMGAPGNTRENYQPYYDGTKSSNVTVFGEAEVSASLLKGITKTEVTCFRPGYLAFHNQLINVLDSLKFLFSSSHSANNVMTNFPFFSHTDLSMTGRLTKVLEIPNHISDVFASDLMSEENYLQKVDAWKTAFFKAYNNDVSSVLLIHPTRYYKLYAQQLLIQSLPPDAIITNLSEYGNYWLNRNEVDFTSSVNADTLKVYLSKKSSELNPFLSFVIGNGVKFSSIQAFDSDNQPVKLIKSAWKGKDIILHFNCRRPDYNKFIITEDPQTSNVKIFPNPSTKLNARVHFEIMNEKPVTISVFDMKGKLVCVPVQDETFNLGTQDVDLNVCSVSGGMYVVKVKIDEEIFFLKWLVE